MLRLRKRGTLPPLPDVSKVHKILVCGHLRLWRIILKGILKKRGVKMWNGFSWLSIMSSGRLM
jgi:hypothetical protein